ncbi:MAG: CYTH domain-containing protein [Lactobacillus sp.]|nr:CYTH domain-containing protein [Lactobacillus sp.]
MPKNREIESKTLLEEAVFKEILKSFPTKVEINQANYYFDTADKILKTHRIAFRIRKFPDKAEATLKVPANHQLQATYHEAIEINTDLSLEQAEQLIQGQGSFPGEVGEFLAQHFAGEKFINQTWSKTHRYLLDGPEHVELTLDQTSYPNKLLDYELEIENNNCKDIERTLAKLTAQFKFEINSLTANQSKIGRAYKNAAR